MNKLYHKLSACLLLNKMFVHKAVVDLLIIESHKKYNMYSANDFTVLL